MRSYFFWLSLGSLVLACSSTPTTTTTIARPELVAVSPDDFMGMEHCGDAPGLVGSYVATLFDVTTASDGGSSDFPLPSSPATACEFPVTFSLVLADHRYRALVEAYDRRPADNAADPDAVDPDAGDPDAGGPDAGRPDSTRIRAVSRGGRLQKDGTGAHVAPRWTTRCGGYPPTDIDAGTGGSGSGVPDGTNGGNAGLPGVVSYGALTTSVHYCPGGLTAVN